MRELLEAAFATGDLVNIVIDTEALTVDDDHGLPQFVLDDPRFAEGIPLSCERRFFSQMEIEFDDEAVEMTLSFDQLHRVKIRYSTVAMVQAAVAVKPREPSKKTVKPQLRLL